MLLGQLAVAGQLLAVGEEFGEPGDRVPVSLAGVGAGGGDLDDRRPRQLGVEGEHLDDRRQPDPHPLQPGLLGVAVGDHLAEDPLDHQVVGGEEALVLVLEVLVEGRAGDVRLLDHVGDRGRLVALAADDPHHRFEDQLTPRFAACHRPARQG